MTIQLDRRSTIAIVGGAFALGSCGMVQKSPFFSTIATFNRKSGAQIDRAKVESIPYASLLAWFDGNAQALLVLGDILPNDRLVWYSADRQSMTTWGAFVLTIVGLDVSLRSTTLVGQWDSDLRKLPGRPLARTLDFESPSGRTTVVAKSRFSDEGLDTVKVLDRSMRLRRVRESVTAEKWHRYTNDYWIDDTGYCWRSRQVVVPTMAPLNVAITRPAQLPVKT